MSYQREGGRYIVVDKTRPVIGAIPCRIQVTSTKPIVEFESGEPIRMRVWVQDNDQAGTLRSRSENRDYTCNPSPRHNHGAGNVYPWH